MPFFQATSSKLPLDREVVNVNSIRDIPVAGPYAMSRNDVNTLTSIRQNPFWKRGPGRLRPRNLDGVDVKWNLNEQTAFEQVLSNDLDEGPLPAVEVEGVARRFGVNKTRFWTKPTACVGFIPFNHQRGVFAGNPAMRKAVNWALDRSGFVEQAGPYAGQPWTHILSPVTPGSITGKRRQPYAPGPNLVKARKLAAGHFRDGKIVVAYRSSGTANPAQAQIVKRDLIRLGFDDANIQMRGFPGGQIYEAMGVRGNDIDLGVSMGWCGSLDAYTDLKDLPYALHNATYERRLARAAKLTGKARLRVLGRLDLEIMRNVAPIAPMRTFNNRYFFSNRVDPRSLVYQPAYTDWSIPALALK
jgi:ABC-type transport system substrate-binding protein